MEPLKTATDSLRHGVDTLKTAADSLKHSADTLKTGVDSLKGAAEGAAGIPELGIRVIILVAILFGLSVLGVLLVGRMKEADEEAKA